MSKRSKAVQLATLDLVRIEPDLKLIDPRLELAWVDGRALIPRRASYSSDPVEYVFALKIGLYHYYVSLSPDKIDGVCEKAVHAAKRLVWYVDRLKARDVVEAWPKGRSTSGPSTSIPSPFGWPESDVVELARDTFHNHYYHLRQSQMVSNGLKSPGLAPEMIAAVVRAGGLIH